MRNTVPLIKTLFLNKDTLHESYCKLISPGVYTYNTDIPQKDNCSQGLRPQQAPTLCSAPGKKEADSFAKGVGSMHVSVCSIQLKIFKFLGWILILFQVSSATIMERHLIFY